MSDPLPATAAGPQRLTDAELEAIRERNEASRERPVDEDALQAAHLAVEDFLIELRDGRISVMGPANGFVVREKDGEPSPIMRLGTRDGLRIGIRAYLATLEAKTDG